MKFYNCHNINFLFLILGTSANVVVNQPSFHTSTSSNASTVIEQPQSKLRRSRSPSSHRKHSDQNGGAVSGLDNKGGIEFKAPLMIEQAEELMLMAKLGKITPKYLNTYHLNFISGNMIFSPNRNLK